jgi:hypothetical protein
LKYIPKTQEVPVLRTDFSNDMAWQLLCTAIRQPVGDFRAYVDFVSDPEYDGIAVEQVLAVVPPDMPHPCIFIVDSIAASNQEHPVLVMDLRRQRGRTFRVIPSAMWGVENNLSLSNMDFEEFADNTDRDGVFRDFRE